MPTLHINGWTPPARAVAIALAEAGLEHDVVEHAWRETPAAFAPFAGRREIANTLEGEFPILVDGDATLSDSYFVLEYIDERYAHGPLRPAHAYGQWRWQAFARFLGERALPAVSSLGVAGCFEGAPDFALEGLPTPERRSAWLNALARLADERTLAESRRKLGLLLERVDAMLCESLGPWLLGPQFTLADIAAFVLVDPLATGAIEGGTMTDRVRDWHDRVGSRTAVRQAISGREAAFLPGPEHARWG